MLRTRAPRSREETSSNRKVEPQPDLCSETKPAERTPCERAMRWAPTTDNDARRTISGPIADSTNHTTLVQIQETHERVTLADRSVLGRRTHHSHITQHAAARAEQDQLHAMSRPTIRGSVFRDDCLVGRAALVTGCVLLLAVAVENDKCVAEGAAFCGTALFCLGRAWDIY